MANDYCEKIDEMVMEFVKNSTDFFMLVRNLKSVHPIEIQNSIYRLFENGLLSQSQFIQIESSAKTQTLEEDDSLKTLPVPHLVDFDWRFSREGIKWLVKKINTYIETAGVIVFIGSPLLYKHYCKNLTTNTEIYLIDFNADKHIKNETFGVNCHIINCNIKYEFKGNIKLEEIRADIVVMDPPWYLEYYQRFFDICNTICKVDGRILGVFPPEMTRNSISDEKQQLSDYVRLLGFEDLVFEKHCIGYSTPPFEKNVLRVKNINNYPNNWRIGDFFITTRKFHCPINLSNSSVCFSSENTIWSETNLGKIRIKFKQKPIDRDSIFDIKINSLYDGDIYPSVSRRFEGHKEINIWTCGNRVYNCSNIPLMHIILQQIECQDIGRSLELDYSVNLTDWQKKGINLAQNILYEMKLAEEKEYGDWG